MYCFSCYLAMDDITEQSFRYMELAYAKIYRFSQIGSHNYKVKILSICSYATIFPITRLSGHLSNV